MSFTARLKVRRAARRVPTAGRSLIFGNRIESLQKLSLLISSTFRRNSFLLAALRARASAEGKLKNRTKSGSFIGDVLLHPAIYFGSGVSNLLGFPKLGPEILMGRLEIHAQALGIALREAPRSFLASFAEVRGGAGGRRHSREIRYTTFGLGHPHHPFRNAFFLHADKVPIVWISEKTRSRRSPMHLLSN